MNQGFLYILTNQHNTTLYTGVTSDLISRSEKHRKKFYPRSFSARYNLSKLVYYERHDSILAAIAREKQLKAGSRKQKVNLINSMNPEWKDLTDTLLRRLNL